MRTNLINLTFMVLLTFSSCSNSKYSNIISQFIELNNEIGNAKEDVGVIIASVRNVINDQEKINTELFSALSSNCVSSEASVNGSRTKLSNSLTESTKTLNEWKATLDSSSKDIIKAPQTWAAGSQAGRQAGRHGGRLGMTFLGLNK